jgi:hypothetical protein
MKILLLNWLVSLVVPLGLLLLCVALGMTDVSALLVGPDGIHFVEPLLFDAAMLMSLCLGLMAIRHENTPITLALARSHQNTITFATNWPEFNRFLKFRDLRRRNNHDATLGFGFVRGCRVHHRHAHTNNFCETLADSAPATQHGHTGYQADTHQPSAK